MGLVEYVFITLLGGSLCALFGPKYLKWFIIIMTVLAVAL